ncbi:MAG: prepilin peptidase [Chloroflexia bacterium]|nr:prepilin peptidase [Chloroflexia bacterium]
MPFFVAVVAAYVLGGLVNLILYRLPRERRLLGRPHCTRCGQALSWEALPLVGYALQRGRCRHCGRCISSVFPLVEFLLLVVFLFLAGRLGLSALAGLYAFFALVLLLTLFLDWQHHYIYYAVLLPGLVVALLGSWLHPNLNVLNSLAAMVIALLFFVLLLLLGNLLFHGEALGLGDVWLAGLIGAMLGFPGGLWALGLGMALAGVVGALLLLFKKSAPRDYMAYGSYLCMGALLYLCLWAP